MYVNNNLQDSKFLNQNLNIDYFIFMYIIYNPLIVYLHDFFTLKFFRLVIINVMINKFNLLIFSLYIILYN